MAGDLEILDLHLTHFGAYLKILLKMKHLLQIEQMLHFP